MERLDSITEHIINETSGALAKRVQRAVELIDRRHLVPESAPIFWISEADLGQHTLGLYTDPGQIQLKADAPEWVIIHEIAHWLDYRAVTTKRLPASQIGYGTCPRSWHLAVNQTAHVKALHKFIGTAANHEQRRHLHYMAKPTELFARAYTQWILLGSDLEEQTSWVDECMERRAINLPAHWKPSDWLLVGEAMDEMFSQVLGWSCQSAQSELGRIQAA